MGLLPQQVLEQVPTLSKLHGDAQMGGRQEHLQGSRHSRQGGTLARVGLMKDPVRGLGQATVLDVDQALAR